MNKKLIIYNFNEEIHKESLKNINLGYVDFFFFNVKNKKINFYLNNKKIDFNRYRYNKITSSQLKKFNNLVNNLNKFNGIAPTLYKNTVFKYNLIENYRELYNIARDIYFDLAFFFLNNIYKKIIFLNKIDTFIELAIVEVCNKLAKTKFLTRTSIQDKIYFSDDYIDKSIGVKNTRNLSKPKIIHNPWDQKSIEINNQVLKNWNSIKYKPKRNIKNNCEIQIKHELIKIQKIINSWNNIKPKNYIFFPLQSDPGRTTQPECGIYQDQYISLLLLSKLIPNKYTILVKEHPRQLEKLDALLHFRGINFYNKIKKIPNIKIISITSKTDELLENSIAVATGTGSIGWMALKKGKPVILFGKPWYSKCYGIIDMNLSFDINKKLENLINQKRKIEKSYLSLQNNIILKFPSGINQSNISKNLKADAKMLAKTILKEITK